MSSGLKAVEKERHSHGGRAPGGGAKSTGGLCLGLSGCEQVEQYPEMLGYKQRGPVIELCLFVFFYSLLKNAQKHQLPYNPLEKVKRFF